MSEFYVYTRPSSGTGFSLSTRLCALDPQSGALSCGSSNFINSSSFINFDRDQVALIPNQSTLPTDRDFYLDVLYSGGSRAPSLYGYCAEYGGGPFPSNCYQ
ncbi:MAG: hypothetical protein AAF654_13020 [Myxococcota bacterium]